MLGHYKRGELIGQGGMGQVYMATHAMLRRPTAIKLINGREVDHETIERFEREVQLATELTHPNTIQIYDYGRTEDGIFYFAMEYLAGMTLADLIARKGPLPPARAIHVIRQVCASLGEAHNKGLVHRDVKPANIMVCERGGEYDFVKVLDFGLVKHASDSADDHNDITQNRQLSGTPLCMAPERIREPSLVDPRSDIYAVGAVAYFLLTGKYPFDGATSLDVLYQILNGPEPCSLQTERSDIPAKLDELILECLAREPNDRPSNMGEVREILDSLVLEFGWTNEDAQREWQLDQHWEEGTQATGWNPHAKPPQLSTVFKSTD
jgi:serine/threonine protein kinase